MSPPDTRPFSRRLFEPRSITTQALVPQIATYLILVLWSFVVLIPLYWAVVTSLKLPIDVDAGPFYIPIGVVQTSRAPAANARSTANAATSGDMSSMLVSISVWLPVLRASGSASEAA